MADTHPYFFSPPVGFVLSYLAIFLLSFSLAFIGSISVYGRKTISFKQAIQWIVSFQFLACALTLLNALVSINLINMDDITEDSRLIQNTFHRLATVVTLLSASTIGCLVTFLFRFDSSLAQGCPQQDSLAIPSESDFDLISASLPKMLVEPSTEDLVRRAAVVGRRTVRPSVFHSTLNWTPFGRYAISGLISGGLVMAFGPSVISMLFSNGVCPLDLLRPILLILGVSLRPYY